MKEFSYTIKDPLGIHARPAGVLITELKKYESAITISRGEETCDPKRGVLALMKLKVKCGETIALKFEGADEDEAAKTALAFLEEKL
jgi:phosphocarrier protein